MITGRGKVSSKGWVVIPKEIRDEMNIRAGDEVTFMYWPPFAGNGKHGFGMLRLTPLRPGKLSDLRGKYRNRPGDRPWEEAFLEEKRREIEREERKVEYWEHRPRSNKRRPGVKTAKRA